MVKRYSGGFLSSTTSTVNAGGAPGLWNSTEHLKYSVLNAWPRLGFVQTGTTSYDFTGYGSYSHIDTLITDLGTILLSTMPDAGFIKYTIRTGPATTQDITVRYVKTGTNNFAQSAFSLFDQVLAYTSSVNSILFYPNDDHDSLVMDGDGMGVISRSNVNNVTGNWDKFRGTTEVLTNSTVESVFLYGPTSSTPSLSTFLGSSSATIISFPKTNSVVWLNLTSGQYRTNNFSAASTPAAITALGSTAPTNSMYTISDGVNSFVIGRYGSTAAAYCTVNLSTGAVTATAITVVAPTLSNSTEEDAFGTQLFTVDGRTTFHNGSVFYYGGARYWRTTSAAWSSTAEMIPFTAGTLSTQTDMDIFGSIDTSGWVWFADWGHDSGGLFNVGDDSQLGTRQTNIKLVPNNYTN